MLDTELTREAGRRFLVGAVRRTFEPGCIHDWIPVLVGPQGLGKSSVLRALVPASEWFSDSTQLDGTPKERMETTGPAVISEFSEMAGLERAEAAKFKTYISKTHDQLRPAYARYAVQSDRRWVGVGTANKDPDGVVLDASTAPAGPESGGAGRIAPRPRPGNGTSVTRYQEVVSFSLQTLPA